MADIGRRVVVRRTLTQATDHPRFTDVLGELVTLNETALVVRRDDGGLITVPLAEVYAAKPIPPRRVRPISARELERIAALGWRGLDEHRIGGWLLRAANGFTGRANAVLPLDSPDVPLDDALAEVTSWYAERGLPSAFQMPLPLASTLDGQLAQRGWSHDDAIAVLTAELDDVLAACGQTADVPPVAQASSPDEAWLARYEYRGHALPDGATAVLVNTALPTFASVRERGRVLAVSRGAVNEGWLGVTAVTVEPDARRRGLATHLLRTLTTWAQQHGATSAYLQVAEDNAAALAMYDKLGFTRHHGYHYRRPPAER